MKRRTPYDLKHAFFPNMQYRHSPPRPGMPGWPRHYAKNILLMCVLSLLVSVPCFPLAILASRLTGLSPGNPLLWAAAAFLWFLVLYTLFQIRFHLLMRRGRDPGPRKIRIFDEALDALDQIAMGDYDVLLETDPNSHFQELSDKINSLARELQSVEQLRQDFVSNVSHEIQSPLTSIRGFAQLLKKEDLPREKKLHYLDIITAESERLSGLSDNLMKLTTLDSGASTFAPKEFSLSKQMEQVLLLLEPQWTAKRLELDVSLDPVTMYGDEELMSEVWINLLQNAIKFTPEGGTIRMELVADEEQIMVVVSDTGIGIPEESLMHVFERFYKADKARDRSLGGNGLGLSLVKKITDLHKGKIRVESGEGKGTAFYLAFPAGKEAGKEWEHPAENDSGQEGV